MIIPVCPATSMPMYSVGVRPQIAKLETCKFWYDCMNFHLGVRCYTNLHQDYYVFWNGEWNREDKESDF